MREIQSVVKSTPVLFFFLLIISLPAFAVGGTVASALVVVEKPVGDFSEISFLGQRAFTSNDLLVAPVLIASDALWYGSEEGQVTISFWVFSDAKRFGQFKIVTEKNDIEVVSVRVNDKVSLEKPGVGRDLVLSGLENIDSVPLKVEVDLRFDPNEIGFSKKFDLVVLDDRDVEIARLDPWLSGWNERRALNIDATHSALIVSTYTHHALNVNTIGWGCADNNSLAITFGGNTEIDADIEGTIGVADVNLFWDAKTDIPLNTALAASDTNGYYVYCKSVTRANPKRDTSSVYVLGEDFEHLAVGGLNGQNNWSSPTGRDYNVFSGADCVGGIKCAKAIHDAAISNSAITLKDFNAITRGVMKIKSKIVLGSGPYSNLVLYSGATEKTAAYMDTSNFGLRDTGTHNFAEGTPDNVWRTFYLDFNSTSQRLMNLDGAIGGDAVGGIVSMASVNRFYMSDNDHLSGTVFVDDIKIYETLASEITYTIGVAEYVAAYSIIYTINTPIASSFQRNDILDVNYEVYTSFCTTTMTTTVQDVSVGGIKNLGTFVDVNNTTRWFVATFFPYDGIHTIKVSGVCDNNSLQVGDQNHDFTIQYGRIRRSIYDENTMTRIPLKTFSFDGNSYVADGNGNFNISIKGIQTGRYAFTLDGNALYNARPFYFDLNEFSQIDQNFLILKLAQGQHIDFKYYKPTDVLFPIDSVVEYRRQYPANGLGGRLFVPASYVVTPFVGTDANYNVHLTASDTNTKYDYNGTTVTVNIPKDFNSLANISPFDVIITNLASQSKIGLTEATNFLIFNDTVNPYNFAISAGATYSTANFAKQTIGGDTNDTIQAYLVPAGIGSAAKFLIKTGNRIELPGIRVNMYGAVSGVKTLLGSGVSDVTGSILWFLVPGAKYYLDFYDETDLLYSTDNYVFTISPAYWYFDLSTGSIVSIGSPTVHMAFNPPGQSLYGGASSLTQTASGTTLNHLTVQYWQYVLGDMNRDKNVLLTKSLACPLSCSSTTLLSAIPFDGNYLLFVDVNAYSDANAMITHFAQQYSINYPTSMNLSTLTFNVRRSFGCDLDINHPCAWGTIVSIFMILFGCIGIVTRFGFAQPTGLMVIAAMGIAITTYIGWFYWPLGIIFIIMFAILIGRSLT